jgi:hypothetical protein
VLCNRIHDFKNVNISPYVATNNPFHYSKVKDDITEQQTVNVMTGGVQNLNFIIHAEDLHFIKLFAYME